jgi:diacylglycerol kinase (ATP)
VPDAPLVIVNPTAGGGRAGKLLPWLRERLERRPDARLRVTSRPGDAEAWAGGVTGAHDRVIAVGGDGTVQEIVNGLLADGSEAIIGIVPVGSGNDLARSLELPRDPATAWTAAMGRSASTVDAAHARGGDGRTRWFASAGGVGFDAEVANTMVARRPWQRGRAGYLASALAELWHFDNRAVRISIDDAEPIDRRILLLAMSNGAYYGGGMHISPGARADDGLMDLCIVGDLGRLAALGQVPNLYRGTHVRHRLVEMRRARTVEIESDADTRIHLDGEPFGLLPVRVELHHAVLSVATPLR